MAKKVDFPLGIADYEEENINGSKHDFDAYKKIHQLIFTPSNDATNPAVLDFYEKDNSRDLEIIATEFGTLGAKIIHRQVQYMTAHDLERIIFHVYSKYRTPESEVATLFENNMIVRADMGQVVKRLEDSVVGTNKDEEQKYLFYVYVDKKEILDGYGQLRFVYTKDGKLIIMERNYDAVDFMKENYKMTTDTFKYTGLMNYKSGILTFEDAKLEALNIGFPQKATEEALIKSM